MSCYKCGLCCKNLYLSDRIKISLHTKTIMLKKKCEFLNKNKLCKIYKNRPKICKEFVCGASSKK
jgi:Fe-S-cluster containining protein